MLFANNIMKLLFVQSVCKDLYKIMLITLPLQHTFIQQEIV